MIISYLKLCNLLMIASLKGDSWAQKEGTISVTYIQNRDVKMTSAPAVLTSSSTLTKSSKQYRDCECDSCLCARGHVVLWCSVQLNFEFRTPSCMCVQLLQYPRQDDWICQPPRMLITSAIFGLAPPPPPPRSQHLQSLPSLGVEWVWPFRKGPLQTPIQICVRNQDIQTSGEINSLHVCSCFPSRDNSFPLAKNGTSAPSNGKRLVRLWMFGRECWFNCNFKQSLWKERKICLI